VTSARDALTEAVAADLAVLADEVGADVTLDRTYESLDRLEDAMVARLDDRDPRPPLTIEGVASYVGSTLAARTGGRWEPPRKSAGLDRPCITRLPGLERARFDPLAVVRTFARIRSPGYLRDTTELHDVSLRTSQLSARVADLDTRIAAFREEAARLGGQAIPPPDNSSEATNAVDAALRRRIEPDVPRDLRRRLRDGAVMYLGSIVQRAVGGGWSVCVDPDDAEVGQWMIAGWAPMSVIRNVGPNSRPTLLHDVLGRAIAARVPP
jgi:hypothetical protein